jgi:23S rRNA G2445 N2-methylase RlmL
LRSYRIFDNYVPDTVLLNASNTVWNAIRTNHRCESMPMKTTSFTAHPQTLELFGPPGGLAELLLEAQSILELPWKPHKFAARLESARGFVRVKNASWDQACELSARLTCAHDVRLALADARIRGWNDLEAVLEQLPWNLLLPHGESLELHTEAGAGVCNHAGKLKRIAEGFLARHGFGVELGSDRFTRLELMTHQHTFRVRLSLGNDALHKRGWRARTGSLATLREDLACVALRRLAELEPRVQAATDMVVPFAGSGTLGLEAWHALCGLPPSVWDAERSWQRLLSPSAATRAWWNNRITRAARAARLVPITLIERDARQTKELRLNLRHALAHLERHNVLLPACEILEADVFKVPVESIIKRNVLSGRVTLMPLHPPYGLRLARSSDTFALYDRLGRSVSEWGRVTQASGGALIGFCLCPSEALWRVFQAHLPQARVHTSHVTQGGLDVRLCAFSFS